MLVAGGVSASGGCVDGGRMLRPFDLNKGQFVDTYHPDNNAPYEIPAAVKDNSAPDADVEDSLLEFLTTPYSKEVKKWWPFEAVAIDDDSTSNSDSSSNEADGEAANSSSGLPSYVPPLLGAILGLLVLGCILALVLYYLRRRRRQIKRLQSDSAASTVVKKRQTWSWLMATRDGGEKGSLHDYDPTPNTEPSDPFDGPSGAATPYGSPDVERPNPLNEAPESQIYEMPGTYSHGHVANIVLIALAGNSVAQELPAARTTKTVTINDDVQEIGANEPISPLSPRPSVNKGAMKANTAPES
jgi:hypothetical protein